MTANNSGTADPRYSKRLAIVVPYRDRADHLARFVPHIAAYFERDKLDRQIAVTINIIEQWGDAPFSRGRLANCGFLLTQDTSDYVCIHDVDYLPMWADYSWTQNPARLIWHGLSMRENWETFFGAVSLLDKSVFIAVNGFPNCYWGWGPEDLEMSNRLRLRGYKLERRDGTFIPLPHKHAGYSAPHVFNDVGRRTNALFAKRQPDFEKLIAQDGISTLKFRLVEKKLLPSTPALPNAFHYIVDVGEPEPGAVWGVSFRHATRRGPMSPDERAIRGLVDTWMKASRAGDTETVLGLMSDDVIFMVPVREPFGKQTFTANSRSMDGVRLEGSADIRELKVLGDWAYLRNFIEITITPPGGAPVKRSGFALTILRKEPDGRWLLARDANLVT